MQKSAIFPRIKKYGINSFVLLLCPLLLQFQDPLLNREPTDLLLQGICDFDVNCLKDTTLHNMRNEAQWGDLVINEIMADPEPPVLLFTDEYVEFFNRSDFSLDIKDWWLDSGGRRYMMNGEGVETIIEPGGYFVLSPVSLSNQGSLLMLYSAEGDLIHAAEYAIPYNAQRWKCEGGWSLESPDPDRVCNTSELWQYSVCPAGGTPGAENSVDGEWPDDQAPCFLYYGFPGDGILSVHFSEPVRLSEEQIPELVLQPGLYRANKVSSAFPLADRLLCHFPVDPSVLSVFTLQMPPVSDCSGNLSGEIHLKGGVVLHPGKESVLINEIMFDPLEDASEYIELFNPGRQFVDLRALSVGVTGQGEALEDLVPVSEDSRIMGPGEYLVLARDIRQLRATYGLEISGSWVEVKGFKSLPDGGGEIWLTDRAGNSLDRVIYGKESHMDLISNFRGISLERIDAGRSGLDPGNWHSAASADGYATPGRLNSQSLAVSDQPRNLEVEPTVFSPDNDGYNDLLFIRPGVEHAGSVISIWITETDGSHVRCLANNHLSGVHVNYTWDGTDEGGKLAPAGFYVVHLRGYRPSSGERWNHKAAVGLIYR